MRDLFLIEDIDWDVCRFLIEDIVEINNEDDILESEYRDYVREPIRLWLCSNGGYIDPGVALYNVIESSVTPVHIIVIGLVASMAFNLVFSADKVFAKPLSRFMYHEVSSGNGGFATGQDEYIQELKQTQSVMDDIIIANSNITKDMLSEIRDRKKDWYFSPQEALELGIIDSLI